MSEVIGFFLGVIGMALFCFSALATVDPDTLAKILELVK